MEWTLSIESEPGRVADNEQFDGAIERFSDALYSDPRALGAAPSANLVTGAVSTLHQVEAPDAVTATAAGVAAFTDAMRAAGLPGGVAHLELAQGAELPEPAA